MLCNTLQGNESCFVLLAAVTRNYPHGGTIKFLLFYSCVSRGFAPH